MTFYQALTLARWVTEHEPNIGIPIPDGLGWAVVVRVPHWDEKTGVEYFERHEVRLHREAREVLGY